MVMVIFKIMIILAIFYVAIAALVSFRAVIEKGSDDYLADFIRHVKSDGIYWIADAVNYFNDIRANRR